MEIQSFVTSCDFLQLIFIRILFLVICCHPLPTSCISIIETSQVARYPSSYGVLLFKIFWQNRILKFALSIRLSSIDIYPPSALSYTLPSSVDFTH